MQYTFAFTIWGYLAESIQSIYRTRRS